MATARPESLEALQALRVTRLARMLALIAAAHPYYSRRFADLGLDPRHLRTPGDLDRLPLTTKADYMAAPEDFRLRAADLPGLPLQETTLWNVATTTGTTSGRPSPFYNTTHDQLALMLQARRAAEVEGFRADDVLANLVPLPPMPTGGFLVVPRTAEAIGIPVVHANTGARHEEFPVHRSLDEAVDLMDRVRPTVFWGIPSFVRRFFRRVTERGLRWPQARMIVTSGEPVSPGLQTELLDHLRALGAAEPQLRLRYSFTEMQGGLVQCCNGAILQNVNPELYLLEVVDPETGRRLPEGEVGAIALTHLDRRGTVLLRYLVGDSAALMLEPCPHCGALGERLVGRPARSDALVKVKGLLINPALVIDALIGDPQIRELQLAVRKEVADDLDSPDVLEVRIEAEESAHVALAARLPDVVQQIVLVRPRVVFAAAGTLFDPSTNLKARRFVDERR
jgi:phenylacetate-coenzyme A ligase PaaK-like adenylate-forming protein